MQEKKELSPEAVVCIVVALLAVFFLVLTFIFYKKIAEPKRNELYNVTVYSGSDEVTTYKEVECSFQNSSTVMIFDNGKVILIRGGTVIAEKID